MDLGTANGVAAEKRAITASSVLRDKVIHGLRWNLIGTVVMYIFRTGKAVILARLLMPEDYGLTAIATSALAMLSLLVGMGFGAALIQKKTEDIRPYADASFWAILLVSLVMVLGTVSAVPSLARFYEDSRLEMIFYVLLVGFLLQGIGSVPESLVQRQMRFKHYNIFKSVVSLLLVLLAITMAATGWGYWSLIIPALVQRLLMIVCNMYIVRWIPRARFSWSAFKGICTFGFTLMFSRIFYFLSSTGTNLLLGKFLAVATFGHVSFARNQSQVPMSLALQQYYSIAYSAFSKLQTDRPRLLKRYYEAASSLCFAMMPILTIGIVLADSLVPAVFGAKWTIAVFPFQMFLIISLISTISSFPAMLVQSIGHPEFNLYANCVRAPLVVGGLCLLGYKGASMHHMVVFLVVVHGLINLPLSLFVWWHLRANVYSVWKAHGPSLCLSILVAVFVVLVKEVMHNYDVPDFVSLGLCVVTGGAFYILVSTWLNPKALRGAVNLVRSIGGVRKVPGE